MGVSIQGCFSKSRFHSSMNVMKIMIVDNTIIVTTPAATLKLINCISFLIVSADDSMLAFASSNCFWCCSINIACLAMS